MLFSFSPESDLDINKEGVGSHSVHHMTEGRSVCICQPGARSQETVPSCNNNFPVVYWPGHFTDLCITFAVIILKIHK